MKFTYTIKKEDEGKKLKEIIRARLGFSSRFLRGVKFGGTVSLDGKPVKLHETGLSGMVIGVDIPEEESYFEPEDIPVSTVYEDEDMLIVDKQPWVVVHPTKGHPTGTMANAIMHDMQQKGEKYKIRFVNRLDRDTSGLLIVGKNAFVQEGLSRQMRENAVKKTYVAIVCGIMEEDEGTIDLPLGKIAEGDPHRGVIEGGEPSVTHFRVLERFLKSGYSLVELVLETGRTHQIRVHLSHLGHPIAGDTLYGNFTGDPHITRQALHAKELVFTHPTRDEQMVITAPMPEDMKQMLDGIM